MQDLSEYAENLFFGTSPEIIELARELRNNLTEAEKVLWRELRNRKLDGYKFRRQHPIDIFIVDYYCHEKKLVIEVDGDIHDTPERKENDMTRTDELKNFGIKVIRFKNDEVFQNLTEVLVRIKQELGQINS